MKHPGHTYGGFVPAISGWGMTGFWKLEMGSLANSASPAEVARAKSNQQNPPLFLVAKGVYERGEDGQEVVRVML
jgi:hypothetical protein